MSLVKDRTVIKQLVYAKNGQGNEELKYTPITKDDFVGDGVLHESENAIQLVCTNDKGAYQLRFLMNRSFLSNALGVRYKISDWEDLKYIAIGFTLNGQFVHVKIPHPVQRQWTSFSFSFNDIVYLVQNQWLARKSCCISDFRIFVKGKPKEGGARIALTELALWLEADVCVDEVITNAVENKKLISIIYSYWRKCYRQYARQVEEFLINGTFPAYGDKNLDWAVLSRKPNELGLVNTYRYSWHALHSVSMCFLRYEDTAQSSLLHSAREFISLWLDASFFYPDEDQKYTWYDHGVAERTLVLVAMFQAGLRHNFDYRFKSRIAYALFKHAQLLSSEAFYASHQVDRYHNHAWFQDIALIAASLCLQHLDVSSSWLTKGLARLKDQLAHLIHRESGYAVFVENSIGYHQGVQRLVDFAGQLETLSGRGDTISSIANELSAWTATFRYPDGRFPAQGDTFRRANPTTRQDVVLTDKWQSQVLKLPDAGYAVLKGGSPQTPWMFGMLATNKNRTHKHEDDLSFFLWLDGVEWLIDPSFMSHEYKNDIPAYLRSAKAHNMLYVDGAEYSYEPAPGRVEMKIDELGDELLNLSITAHNRSCAGYEIVRRLVCSKVQDLPKITCTDQFFNMVGAAENSEKETTGILTFHFGDGVKIRSTKTHEMQTCFELTHPATNQILVLNVMHGSNSAPWNSQIEPSVCGLGFMENIATQALRITIPKSTECNWSIDVH